LVTRSLSTPLRIDGPASHVHSFNVNNLSKQKNFSRFFCTKLKPSSVQYCVGDIGTIRADALSLLKELRASFQTLELVEAVALLKEKERDSWFLSVKWVAGKCERDRLNRIASERSVGIFESNGYTLFHDFKKTH
jgi:hypothetical protein